MIQFRKGYDVVVAGGGVAGVAAALASARAGLKTALVEKTVSLGGLATSGLIIWYTPLCDGLGKQVTFGIAEELLRASIKYGPFDVPEGWRDADPPGDARRFGTRFSAASFMLALDELVTEAGVDVWFDTLICHSVVEGDRVTGIEVENKSGRGLLQAKCFVDATGDADVAFRAGAPCAEQDNWLSHWSLEMSLDIARKAVEQDSGEALVNIVITGASDNGTGQPEGIRRFHGTKGKDVSEFVLTGRRLLREHYAAKQAELGERGRHDVWPIMLPSIADFRTTRRIEGHATLRAGMHSQTFDDSVGLIASWRGREAGQVWQVPYGVLVPRSIRGLLAAGRCISCEGQAWEITRIIHGSAHTGELAGIAAALAVRNDTTPDALDVSSIQAELSRLGIAYVYEPLAEPLKPIADEGPPQVH